MFVANSLVTAARAAIRSTSGYPIPNAFLTGLRPFSSKDCTKDWSVYYKIEANNAARMGATQLTVSGPDIDGILANMTVALAMKGCSLVELHAGSKSVDTASHHHVYEHEERPMIYDVFYVVERRTGYPFDDQDLEPLARSLLESLKTPMNLVGLGGSNTTEDDLPEPTALPPGEEQITIVKSTDKS